MPAIRHVRRRPGALPDKGREYSGYRGGHQFGPAYNRPMAGADDGSGQMMFDVAVVGRGSVGAAAALALAQAGLRTTCIGPLAPPATATPPADDWDPRIFALSPSSRRLLQSLRIWDAMDGARIAPVYDMRVYPGPAAAGAVELHFDAYEARVDALAWILEGRNLAATFERALGFSAVTLFDASVTGIDADRSAQVTLSLDNGRRIGAKLLVGADGAQSVTRRLCGIDPQVHEYPQTAVVANFAGARPHRDTACQWFGAHGVLAMLPLPGERLSMVWSAPHALAAELQGLPPQELVQRVVGVAGLGFAGLWVISPAQAFPLKRIDCPSLIGERLVLVGDAAHVVHPLAGQGMNLGFGDVSALGGVMAGRERHRDPGDPLLLRRYERARSEPVAAMRLTTDALQKLFDTQQLGRLGALAAPVAFVRDSGWRLVASSGWLRRRLIEAAAAG